MNEPTEPHLPAAVLYLPRQLCVPSFAFRCSTYATPDSVQWEKIWETGLSPTESDQTIQIFEEYDVSWDFSAPDDNRLYCTAQA